MLTSPRGRAAALVVLGAALAGLLVWYGSMGVAPGETSYPGTEALGADYDRYVGQQVELYGTVVETDPLVIESTYGDGRRTRYVLEGVDRPVGEGDRVGAFGVAREGRRIEVENAVVVPSWGLPYTYGVSFLAGVWVLWRIVRDWALDRTELGLTPDRGGEEGA